MKATKGTTTKIDKGTKTVAVKSADGTEKTDHTDNAAKDFAKELARAWYRAEETGKTAHFFAGSQRFLHVDEQLWTAASATHKPDLSAMRVLLVAAVPVLRAQSDEGFDSY